jgi:hypothetical protein
VRVLVGNHCRRDGMQMDMHQGSNVLLVRQPPDKGRVKLNADDTSKEMHVSSVLVWATGFQISSGFAQCS